MPVGREHDANHRDFASFFARMSLFNIWCAKTKFVLDRVPICIGPHAAHWAPWGRCGRRRLRRVKVVISWLRSLSFWVVDAYLVLWYWRGGCVARVRGMLSWM